MDRKRFELEYAVPSAEDYLGLRAIAGLSPRDLAATEAGLPNSCVAVTVSMAGRAVAMGRVIGDGALFFQVVDIAVDPEFQGQGLGRAVMAALMERLAEIVPGTAYVSLIADGEAHRLYSQYGFEPVEPRSRGMAMWLSPARAKPE